jgi:UDP-GlcNAc:undecaprenyl-phosphate GlcNAc-1-phosphate transferase
VDFGSRELNSYKQLIIEYKKIFMLSNLFFTSLFATIIFILVLYPYALKIGFTDKPDLRKQHKEPTPPIGGIAIFLATLVTLVFNDINLPQQTAFILAMTLLVVVGVIDDNRGLGVKIRLIAQIVAGLIMTEIADIKIIELGDLLGFGNINLGIYSTAFTVFAVVGGINAFNMIDGIDGLAGGLTLISIITIALLSWYFEHWILLYFCIIFIGALIAFLLFNLRIFGRARGTIFLGDSGSTLLGFTVCWLAISASQGEGSIIAPTVVLWIIALPLFDSICIMCRRLQRGQSPFAPDREHLHHVLPLEGFSVNKTLVTLLIFSLLLSVTGITARFLLGISERLLFISFLLLFAGYYWAINKRIGDRRRMTIQIDGPDRRKLPDRRSKTKKENTPAKK